MAWTLTKLSLRGGTYRGVLTGPATMAPPDLVAEHGLRALPLTLAPIDGQAGEYQISVTLPPEVISDGVQVVVIRDKHTTTPLATIAVIAGDDEAPDLAQEVALLRAELDLLKRAFRRLAQQQQTQGD